MKNVQMVVEGNTLTIKVDLRSLGLTAQAVK